MLQRPWMTPFVVVFWCLASGWLLRSKILPTLSPGSPPGGQARYLAGDDPGVVAWTVQWNDLSIGWACTQTDRTALGGLAVETRMHLDRLPIEDIVPAWMSVVTQNLLPAGDAGLDAHGHLAIDADGNVRGFDSVIQFAGATDPVRLRGTIDTGTARVQLRIGGMRYDATRQVPHLTTLGEEFSPHATMPGLYQGRRWTVPVYSPLLAGNARFEILHAEVGPEEMLFWENHLVRVHPVAVRDDPAGHRPPRSRLWVDRTGRVLRQEAMLLGSRLTFVRRPEEAARRLAAAFGPPVTVDQDATPPLELAP
jgi:hypothetical protein